MIKVLTPAGHLASLKNLDIAHQVPFKINLTFSLDQQGFVLLLHTWIFCQSWMNFSSFNLFLKLNQSEKKEVTTEKLIYFWPKFQSFSFLVFSGGIKWEHGPHSLQNCKTVFVQKCGACLTIFNSFLCIKIKFNTN